MGKPRAAGQELQLGRESLRKDREVELGAAGHWALKVTGPTVSLSVEKVGWQRSRWSKTEKVPPAVELPI